VGRTHEREYGTGGLGEGRGTRGTGSFIIARPLRGGGGAGGPARSGLTLAWTVDTSKILRVHCLRPDLDAVYVFLLFFFALVALLLLENRTRCDRSSIFFHRVNRKSRRLGALRVTMRQRIFSSVRLFFLFFSFDGRIGFRSAKTMEANSGPCAKWTVSGRCGGKTSPQGSVLGSFLLPFPFRGLTGRFSSRAETRLRSKQ
jgi:hypothetical protein